MKFIKYKMLSYKTETEQIFMDVSIACKTQAEFDANYPIAEKEAIGEIIVDGEFEVEKPTQMDAIEAQVAYTAMMTDTLLEV